jgi:hypothetical protein
MCAGVDRSGSRTAFAPDAKCCTYIPHLANFLTGRALSGPGTLSVRARIERRAGVTPLGLGLSPEDLRRVADTQSHFGTAPVLRCPHFVEESQGCAVWESRNAVCSTWFCQHERGELSQRFWHAVRDLLLAAEERMARHCLERGGLPLEQVARTLDQRRAMQEAVGRANAGLAPDVDEEHEESAEQYARLWGAWQGREVEWFSHCADTADTVGDIELRELVDDVPELVEAVRSRLEDLGRRELPLRLRFAPGPASEATSDVLRLVGYSPFDPVVLPADLEPGLWLLDGRPLTEVLAGSDHDTRLDADVLGRLHDFGLAVDAPP